MKATGLLLMTLFFCSTVMAQGRVLTLVTNYKTGAPIAEVSIYNSKGQLLGKTDKNGQVAIKAKAYPLFIAKRGYATEYAYNAKELKHVRLHHMGGTLPTIYIHGGLETEDSLLALRDDNLPYFNERDTVLYYHFNYSLNVVSEDWQEAAEGYIAVNFKGVGASIATFNPYRYATFLEFNYQGDDRHKPLPPCKIMPAVLMFGSDWMSGYGYHLWQQLTGSFVNKLARYWEMDSGQHGDRIFSAFGVDSANKLLEKLVFDHRNRLKRVYLFTPEYIHSIGSIRIFNNFGKGNGVNSFRTVYTYSDNDSNRVLDSLNHFGTYYEKGKVYYKMKFSAQLVDKKPKVTRKLPLYYLAYNHYYPEMNGLGVQLLLEKHYNIKRDRWLKSIDREYEQYREQLEKRRQQQKADSVKAASSK